MKAEGHEGILLEALTAMISDKQLKLIDFLEIMKTKKAAFEKAVYYHGSTQKHLRILLLQKYWF